MPILFFVNCERTVIFSVKHDLDPPFTTHYKAPQNVLANNSETVGHKGLRQIVYIVVFY